MKKYQIFKIVKNFSENERSEFAEFLNSPLHNSDKTLYIVYSEFLKFLSSNKVISPGIIKSKIIKRTNYAEKTISNKLSYLTPIALEFIKYRKTSDTSDYLEIFRNKWLLETDLNYLFLLKQNDISNKLTEKLKTGSEINEDLFHKIFLNNVNTFLIFLLLRVNSKITIKFPVYPNYLIILRKTYLCIS